MRYALITERVFLKFDMSWKHDHQCIYINCFLIRDRLSVSLNCFWNKTPVTYLITLNYYPMETNLFLD